MMETDGSGSLDPRSVLCLRCGGKRWRLETSRRFLHVALPCGKATKAPSPSFRFMVFMKFRPFPQLCGKVLVAEREAGKKGMGGREELSKGSRRTGKCGCKPQKTWIQDCSRHMKWMEMGLRLQ